MKTVLSTSAVFFTMQSFVALTAMADSSVVKIDGSSTVYPLTEAVAEDFQITHHETKVTVGISGTGGGFKKFCRGETDIQDASRPITKEEMAVCRENSVTYFEFPIAFDSITVVVSPKNTWLKEVSVADLKKIWEPAAQGKITKWNQVRAEWPDAPIKLYGAGSDSGTFDYFTEAVVGKAKASRGDYTASEDDNTLVQGIKDDKNALGYIPYAYFEANKSKLRAVGIVGGEKAPKKVAIMPTKASVIDGTYFPLSRPIFIYVSAKSATRPEIRNFTEFYLKNIAKLADQVKYVALPPKAYTLGLKHFKDGKLGTKFGGEPKIGLRIEEILKLEATL